MHAFAYKWSLHVIKSLSLKHRNTPRAFAREEPVRIIASLELFGALVEVMLLLPECDWRRLAGSTRVITVGCATDNQGNHHLLDRLMLTGYSLDLILKLSYRLEAEDGAAGGVGPS